MAASAANSRRVSSKSAARVEAAPSVEVEPKNASSAQTTAEPISIDASALDSISQEASLPRLLIALSILIAIAVGFCLQPSNEQQPSVVPAPPTISRHTNLPCMPVFMRVQNDDDVTAFEHTFVQLVHRTRRPICLYVGVDALETTGRRLEPWLDRHLQNYVVFEAAPSAASTPGELVHEISRLAPLASLREAIVIAPEALVFSDLSKLWLSEACVRVRAGAPVASVQSGDSGVLCANLERARCLHEPAGAVTTLPNYFNCHGLSNESLSERCILDGGSELRQMTARCAVMRWNGGNVKPWSHECSFHRHYWARAS